MSARILVVDDVPANVKLLEARLSAEYFDVVTATTGIMRNSGSSLIQRVTSRPETCGS